MKRLRVIFFGAKGVGKTSLLTTMAEKRFVSVQPTIGVDYTVISYEDRRYLCWDVSGDPSFRKIGEAFNHECSVFVYVFDLRSEQTLDQVLSCHERMMIHHGLCSHFLIGNFSDMGVLTETMKRKMDRYSNLLYYETCALHVDNVERMWDGIHSGTLHLLELDVTTTPRQRAQCCTLQ